jgi:hypothetical protein
VPFSGWLSAVSLAPSEGSCEDGNPLLSPCRPWGLVASVARASASMVPGEIPATGPVVSRMKHWCTRGLNLFWWLVLRVVFHGLGEHSLNGELAAESVAVMIREYESLDDAGMFPRVESW